MSEYQCSVCGKKLTWAPQYGRWYCYECKGYAGERGIGGKPIPKVIEEGQCPKCEQQMQYVQQYQAWYCPRCRSYKTMQGPTTNIPCPRCRNVGMVYSYQYRKWFCPTCRDYPNIPEVRAEEDRSAQQKGERRVTVIDDLFLMYNDGRLIRHYTRRLKPLVDTEILSSMLTAVQDFIRDAFPSDDKEGRSVEEIKMGELRIVVHKGKYVSIASLISGDDPEHVTQQVAKCIYDMENEQRAVLEKWDGDIAVSKTLQKYVSALLAGEYA
ncbi:MAG: hypothetical protein HZB92_07035 [Euryarchaeota archaeon]|nr:hypothetical protein [Euryarchaeota archaeon]